MSLDWFQRDAEEWKDIHEHEFAKFLHWKRTNDDTDEVDLDPILVDPVVSAVNEYTHMVHRGAMSKAISLAINHLTVSERELLYILLDCFGHDRKTRFSLPRTGATHFYLKENGDLSSQFTKMNHVPGVSLIFTEALNLVWCESRPRLCDLFRKVLTILAAFWGDFVRSEKFGGVDLDNWLVSCRDLLDECLWFCTCFPLFVFFFCPNSSVF